MNIAICDKLNVVQFGHLLLGFHFSGGQAAGAHADNLLVAHFRNHRGVPGLPDLMLSVLVQLWTEKIMPIIVMLVLGNGNFSGNKEADRNNDAKQSAAVEHV
jgi:hypothetical protein